MEPIKHRGKLTARVKRFIEEYTTRPDAGPEAAALKAGYSPEAAKKTKRILDLPVVQQAINEKMAPIMERNNVTRESIIKRVAEKFHDPSATHSEVARLGKLLAEMTPGALVPVQVNHSGLSLEEFIEAGSASPGADQTHKEKLQ